MKKNQLFAWVCNFSLLNRMKFHSDVQMPLFCTYQSEEATKSLPDSMCSKKHSCLCIMTTVFTALHKLHQENSQQFIEKQVCFIFEGIYWQIILQENNGLILEIKGILLCIHSQKSSLHIIKRSSRVLRIILFMVIKCSMYVWPGGIIVYCNFYRVY